MKRVTVCSLRRSGYDPDGHNCYLSAVEVNTLTNLDLVFDDSWSVYESYLADYCPQNIQPFPSGGGGSDGKFSSATLQHSVAVTACWIHSRGIVSVG